MLIEFKTRNFLSFKELTMLSMVAAKSFKEHKDSHIIKTEGKLDLLKSAIIYGNNAGGKSNLLRAMSFMKMTILTSFQNALTENRRVSLEKFALSTKTENEPSFFEVSFIQKGTKYRYGFEIDYDKIVAEWLFHTKGK
jgi:AAA15 family ATPase/GTPase